MSSLHGDMEAETPKAQDARVEKLWSALDARKKGELDLAGLKKGLGKLDHPLKNADPLLSKLLDKMDTDRNGRISYQEFRTFVMHAESELHKLFHSIDRNHDGSLDRSELQDAFRKAGLVMPDSKLDKFFAEVDADHDGEISFQEWRDFLLFVPVNTPNLNAIMTYFSTTLKVNAEGDVQLSDETIHSIGTARRFFRLHFGSLLSVAQPQRVMLPPEQLESSFDFIPPDDDHHNSPADAAQLLPPHAKPLGDSPPAFQPEIEETRLGMVISVLIACVPHPGYFVAGGIAGIVSRTTTAPLDRLKVYLIAQTDAASDAISAAKSGAPLQTVKHGARSITNAMMELWRAGGVQSLWAGNGINIVKVMPESAVKFGAYEASKRAFARAEGHNDVKQISSASKFLCGGVAGMISQFAVYPLDTLKFRMQCETVEGGLHGNKLIWATAAKMWKQGGIFPFYRGITLGLVGIFPYAALDLGTFEWLKKTITKRNAKVRGCHEEQAEPGGFMTAAIGGVSGAFGASVVYPINVLRTRIQSQGTVLHPRTYTGLVDVTRQTIKGEGFRGLFKGLTPNLLKVVPAVSITYVVYEQSKKALKLP